MFKIVTTKFIALLTVDVGGGLSGAGEVPTVVLWDGASARVKGIATSARPFMAGYVRALLGSTRLLSTHAPLRDGAVYSLVAIISTQLRRVVEPPLTAGRGHTSSGRRDSRY
eukprot:3576265-Pyramimonas_sp.AAC.2